MAILERLTILAVADILITAFLIYQFLLIIKGRRAAQILLGLTVVLGFYIGARLAGLQMVRSLLETVAPYTAFALIVMFQSEIRRVLAQLGRRGMGFSQRLKQRESIDEIQLAAEQLSRTKTGALIVLERYSGLRTFVESGVMLDAVVSRDLLLSIFHPKGALHDGAVIIQNERITAAACFLPLSMNPAIMNSLGTRHRAAIGITEESDCLAVIVSEETGTISVAAGGRIERELTVAALGSRIASHLGGGPKQAAAGTAQPGPAGQQQADGI